VTYFFGPPCISSPLISDILLLHNDLYNHNFDIIFFWIPSYVGIIGYTKVDLLAKTPSLSPITNIPIPATDFFVNVHSVIKSEWQSRWNLHPTNKLYKIYPNVSALPPLPNTSTRKEETTLNRLLIGYSHLTHSYLLNKDSAPICEHWKCVLTIEHILCTCTKYEHKRKQHFPKSQLSHILLHSPKRNIFNYLTDINLLTNYKISRHGLTVLKVSLNPNQSIIICTL